MYHNIMVAFDGSEPSKTALVHAAKLARALGASLRVAYVEVDPALYFPLMAAALPSVAEVRNVQSAETLAVREAALNLLAREGVAAGFLALPLVDSHMHIADRLLSEAKRVGADLVVTGTHGRRGLARLTLGSEANRVLQHADLPVLVVKSACP
ncbi:MULTISPECIES: universal stress protein [Pandoraea]|uniref:UspA domain-containing protein n=1 Tax=Pandoraea communis TaxID=2508297 RepID=A0A5E4YGY0_9BURK|nr:MULTISPECIES: universal stress protein [Pandoraea]EON15273.1 UspA domain-containing protein [Pandoraea sp. SD6-2]VVE47712.1 UspA domain-containing protein [Pandoraea communis]